MLLQKVIYDLTAAICFRSCLEDSWPNLKCSSPRRGEKWKKSNKYSFNGPVWDENYWKYCHLSRNWREIHVFFPASAWHFLWDMLKPLNFRFMASCCCLIVPECSCPSWANTTFVAVLWDPLDKRKAQCFRVIGTVTSCCEPEQEEFIGKLVGRRQTGMQWGTGRSCEGLFCILKLDIPNIIMNFNSPYEMLNDHVLL